MDGSSIASLFFVLLPFSLVILFVALKIKRQLDEYVPKTLIVRKDGECRKISIETGKKRLEIKVKDFRQASSKDVLELRINGLSFGKYRLGLYKGPYGYVESYATSDSGIFIEDETGKKYFVAFKNSEELLNALNDKAAGERVIRVES